MGGLIPAIVQDNNTSKVLMLGFMNQEAYDETVSTGKVTFFSRTKNRLWMKGESSGNTLQVVSITADCDNDTLLIKAIPAGPVCMTHDGVKDGYANDALATLADTLHIPVIASGGAGKMEHFRDTFSNGKADAALAASVFHFGEIRIGDLKQYLKDEGINVRI